MREDSRKRYSLHDALEKLYDQRHRQKTTNRQIINDMLAFLHTQYPDGLVPINQVVELSEEFWRRSDEEISTEAERYKGTIAELEKEVEEREKAGTKRDEALTRIKNALDDMTS